MKQVMQNFKSGELRIDDMPVPSLKPGGVLVKNYYSIISAGTEKMVVDLAKKSMYGKAKERPDLVRMVINKAKKEGILNTFRQVREKLDNSIPLGYSCAGEVIAVGEDVTEFAVGDKVACAGAGYANHAEVVFVPKNLCVKIPEGVNLGDAAYVTLGSIAMQGVRVADPKLGERFAVIGLGLLGQITVQILKAAGCEVVGIDLDPEKVAFAKEMGADLALQRNQGNLTNVISAFSQGYGLDGVIITAATSSNDPVELAGELCREKGRVVVVGAVKMDVPRPPFYGKELDLRLSKSYGPGRYDSNYEEKGVDYPIGYVRWTEKRNMEEFLRLLSKSLVQVNKLTTHQYTIKDAAKGYDLISGKVQEKYLGILLQYNPDKVHESRLQLKAAQNRAPVTDKLNIGVIGTGGFAKGVLIPAIRKSNKAQIHAVAASTGISAKQVGEKVGAAYCTSDYSELLRDPNVHCVVIATRHNLHAPLAVQALKQGKSVFVEKPLAMNIQELKDVLEAAQNSNQFIMTGFNRRFAPMTNDLKKMFVHRANPIMVQFRVNAGHIAKDHWVQDPVEGGGRILGEVCHFVDFIQHITDAEPVSVHATCIQSNNAQLINPDNVFISISFSDGSIGQITYSALGDTSFAKERVEVFGEGKVGVLEDFRSLTMVAGGKTTIQKSANQDKGHEEEIKQFVHALTSTDKVSLTLRSQALTTLTTIRILDSLRTGLPMTIDLEDLHHIEVTNASVEPEIN